MARFAIVAYSLVNALGSSTREVMRAAFAGEARFTAAPADLGVPFAARVGAMTDLPAPPPAFDGYDTRLVRIAAMAAREVEDAVRGACARFSPERVGLVLGTCTGGLDATERAYPALAAGLPATGYAMERHHPLHLAQTRLAVHFGLRGPSHTVSTACSSSAKAFATAHRWLRAGIVDAVVVGGADTLCRTTLFGFQALGALAAGETQPFTTARDGLTLGEGAAFVVVQRSDGPLALCGVGESADGYHLSAPDPEGRGALRAMNGALESAARDQGAPFDMGRIGQVSAHGTGTPHNDSSEGAAIAALFGPHKLVTATKSLTGHLLGAAGVSSVVFAAESLQRGLIPPTRVSESALDPSIAVRVATQATSITGDAVLVNAFGFGGNNSSVLLSR